MVFLDVSYTARDVPPVLIEKQRVNILRTSLPGMGRDTHREE